MQKTRHSVTYPRDSRLQDGWLREAYGQTAPEERGEKDKRQGWGAGVGVGGGRSQASDEHHSKPAGEKAAVLTGWQTLRQGFLCAKHCSDYSSSVPHDNLRCSSYSQFTDEKTEAQSG